MGFCNSNARFAEQEQSLGKAMGVKLRSFVSLKNGGFWEILEGSMVIFVSITHVFVIF